MDALRLIKTARHALAEARTVPDALQEAWQAGLLTEAVGARIAEREIGEVGALGQLLYEAGAHAASCLEQPSEDSAGGWPGGSRADRLGEIDALDPLLRELEALLHEVAETLVVLACGADAESLYWRCIDGVDAGAECKDLVVELLRTVRKQARGESGPDEPVDRSGRGAQQAPGPPAAGPADDRPGERVEPILVVSLAPPARWPGHRPGATGMEASLGLSAKACSSTAQAPEDCRAVPSARSVLTEAGTVRICSGRPMGVRCSAGATGTACGAAAAVGAGMPEVLDSLGAAGASDQCSDIRVPLQLGSAV